MKVLWILEDVTKIEVGLVMHFFKNKMQYKIQLAYPAPPPHVRLGLKSFHHFVARNNPELNLIFFLDCELFIVHHLILITNFMLGIAIVP